jgi:predicted ATP-dependent endonuclease of OLD family
LRDVELDLEPLTVLVGPNASGKSSILKALGSTEISGTDRWQHTSTPNLDLWFEDDRHVSVQESASTSSLSRSRSEASIPIY